MLASALSVNALASDAERALIQSAGFSGSNVGFVLFDPAKGQILRSHNANSRFVPASMVKIVTALAALEVLGPEHRFRTTVLGRASGGGLHVHLSGGGDPVLVQEDLDALAEALVLSVAGRSVTRFTFDEALLPSVERIDLTDDPLKAYNPPISALSVNFNRQWLRWFRDDETRAMRVGLRPDLPHALAGLAPQRFGDGRSIRLAEDTRNLFLLDPRVPSAGQRSIAVLRPALRTAYMLRADADRSGLPLPAPEALTRPPVDTQVLATHDSRPMVDIAVNLLKYSNNLSAELIGLATARRLSRDVHDLGESAAAVRAWLSETIPAATEAGWRAHNQSGLTSVSRTTPAALLSILRFATARHYTAEGVPYAKLMPEIRWTRWRDDVEIRAKSGTMFYARGLAGVLTRKGRQPLLFVLMHTDFDARERYERNPERFRGDVQARANRWVGRAVRLEQLILSHWIATF